jgi:DNA-directed RNA polymerase subunit RPC12/RpoP
MSEELLFKNWKEFITLLPDEKIIRVYKKVKASKFEEKSREYEDFMKGLKILHTGDLILTNKRLFHLLYGYEETHFKRRSRISQIILKVILFFAKLIWFASFFTLFLGLLLILFLSPLGAVIFLLSLLSLFLIPKVLPRSTATKYIETFFEVPLEDVSYVDIDSLSSSLLIKLKQNRIISLDFHEKSEMNEFRKNFSFLVYEAQHRPKEIVSYNIVTEFNLNKDGTISVKCPYCGAPTPLHSKESEVVCKYCGKTYIVPKKILDLIS